METEMEANKVYPQRSVGNNPNIDICEYRNRNNILELFIQLTETINKFATSSLQ